MLTPTQITTAAHGSSIVPEYSSVCPFSKDNLYILLIAQDHFLIYDRTMGPLPDPHIGASERPRWSRRNVAQFSFLRSNFVMIYDVNLGIVDSYQFPEYKDYELPSGEIVPALDDKGEADQQGDSRVLVGTRPDGHREIFVLDVVTGARGPVMPTTGEFNNLLLTPSLKVLVNGMLLLDPQTMTSRLVFNTNQGHKAVTRYKGRDVMLITNSDENPVTLPDFPNGIVMVDLETGEQKGLLTLPWNLAVHISAPADAEWCLVTTYDPLDPDAALVDGEARVGYSNAILKVALDGSGAEILCYHFSDSSSYLGQPKATVSGDGSRFVYAKRKPDGTTDTWLGVLAAPEPPPPPVVWPGHPYPGEGPQDRFWGRFWRMLLRLIGVHS